MLLKTGQPVRLWQGVWFYLLARTFTALHCIAIAGLCICIFIHIFVFVFFLYLHSHLRLYLCLYLHLHLYFFCTCICVSILLHCTAICNSGDILFEWTRSCQHAAGQSVKIASCIKENSEYYSNSTFNIFDVL